MDTLNNTSFDQMIPDKRVQDWLLMDNALPICCILASYLYFIYKLGPQYMEKKQPYSLKVTLACYNIGQVLACAYLMKEIALTRPVILYFWECGTLDQSTSPDSLRLLRASYFTFALKLIELIETIFFILRKKYNQVSFLHVYHHCSTVMLAWMLTKYFGSTIALFSVFLNHGVHVVMYSYYLTSLLGKDTQKKLIGWKKSITIVQMIQFTVLIAQIVVMAAKGCSFPKAITSIYMLSIGMIFYMFYDFYKKSYAVKKLHKEELIKVN